MRAKTIQLFATATIIAMVIATSATRADAAEARVVRLPAMSCEALVYIALPDTVISSARAVEAQGAAPRYCKVLATVDPETDIEVRLPDAWQERLLHIGGSGLDGTIPNLNANNAQLREGYALTGSNGGHRDPSGGPARLLNEPALIQDYAHTAIRKTVLLAKAIIRAYYGDSPRYSYFAGCSNGGREALNAAAKYGDEYDGVIAGSQTLNTAGIVSGWVRAALLTAPSAAKIASLYRAELAQCDASDGLADGIISNPRACRFDPATIRCAPGTDDDSCLTDSEIRVVNTIRSELELANGKLVYSRLGIGDPSRGFGVFQPLGPPGSPTVASFGGAYLGYIVYSDPSYDPAKYDVNRDLHTVDHVLESVYGFTADTVALKKYLRSGKKIIVWHGTEDMAVSHIDAIRTYETMIEAAGKGADNARLYTPPGVQHCGGGPGADRFDLIGALTNWIENGSAPHTLVAAKVNSTGSVVFTRPLCEFPGYPQYVGYGDPTIASSFECVRSKPKRADDTLPWSDRPGWAAKEIP
jgi:tannase/feruloyl esterase